MSRLEQIEDWLARARTSRYSAVNLARACGVSPGHLRRFFSEQFGITPQEWLNELRLWDAAQLVCDHRSLKEIAFELSFGNPVHLCHAFKKYHGCTPGAFARLYEERKLKLETLFREKSSEIASVIQISPWRIAEHSLKIQVTLRIARTIKCTHKTTKSTQ